MSDEIRTTAEAAEADALMPRCREVHKDGSRGSVTRDAPDSIIDKPVEKKSPAQWAYERLILYIQNFEKMLDNEHEVAMGFVGSDAGVLKIEGMGYFDPDIITFYGSDAAGGKTQLVQHVNQLSVILRAQAKPKAQAEPERIGFRLAAELDKD
ncbi:DUF6173 family protein [Roseovarius sp. M141]|uniref:DUF6173 family protein n=1 Tax=Roseovarius sp. M141 TaxID=2583806 RepID=UPI0020CF578B|nr:DUF6173 family protein [Roseovarius sp. M141]MCQ0091773.1 hypothetical protein [Roseovarius sp. M141]